MSNKRKLAYAALLCNAFVWGAALPLIKPVFNFISPLQYLYLRFFMAALLSLPIFLFYYIKKHPKITITIKILLTETIQILALPLLYLGLEKTGALEASLIGATGPIFIVLGGIWFLHERENKREWQGLSLSVFGSLLIVAEPLITGAHIDTPTSSIGNIYVLAYNLIYMVYVITAKKVYKTKPPLYFGSLIYGLSALIYGIMLLSNNSLPSLILLANHNILFPVLYMAIPGGILAFALYLYAQSKIEVSEANLFTYLNGVIAIPTAYFFLGEIPTMITILAIILIALGVYRAEVKKNSS